MSRILKEIHDSVSRGYAAGIIDLSTMQKFDNLCMIYPPDETGRNCTYS